MVGHPVGQAEQGLAEDVGADELLRDERPRVWRGRRRPSSQDQFAPGRVGDAGGVEADQLARRRSGRRVDGPVAQAQADVLGWEGVDVLLRSAHPVAEPFEPEIADGHAVVVPELVPREFHPGEVLAPSGVVLPLVELEEIGQQPPTALLVIPR